MSPSAALADRPLDSVLHRIPPFPAAMAAIVRACSAGNVSAADIAQAVSLEEVLAVRVVRAANSAALAPVHPVNSVTAAVARLGSDAVRSIASAYFLNSAFSPGFAQAGLDRASLWRHNLAVAAASAGAASNSSERANAYFAGLTHDVGIMVFAAELGRAYADILAQAAQTAEELCRLEAQYLGLDHAALGAEAAAAWNFAPDVTEAIARHHHFLTTANVPPLVSYVVVGNQVAKDMGLTVCNGYGPLGANSTPTFVDSLDGGIMSRARWALTNEMPRIEALVSVMSD